MSARELITMHAGALICRPLSGGKAGKGKQRTSTVQVIRGNQLIGHYRYLVHSQESYYYALSRAKALAEKTESP